MSGSSSLIKIGRLAKLAGILPSKVRYYVQEGLLSPVGRTRGGYYLFDEAKSLERLNLIEQLKKEERLSLTEITERLNPHPEN